MTYSKPTIEDLRTEPVYAGGCGDFSSSCGNAVHKSGATGACGDYDSSCYKQVHKRSGNAGCGDSFVIEAGLSPQAANPASSSCPRADIRAAKAYLEKLIG